MTPFSAAESRLLAIRSPWAVQAAAFVPRPGAWAALAEARHAEAAALAQAEADTEAMAALARLSGNAELAAGLQSLAAAPDARDRRNRAAAAIRANDWNAAAAEFAAGLAETGEHADWCREGLGLLFALAARWEAVAELLGPPGEAADRGLGLHAHLCRIAAADALGRDLGPDLRPNGDTPAPNRGCGDPGRTLGGDLIAFCACDPVYLRRYTLAALASLAEAHPGAAIAVHLHLYDAADADRELAARAARALGFDLALSDETGPAEADPARRGAYRACARFCRLAEALPRYAAPVVALDADALVRRDLRPLAARVTAVGLTTSPLSVPWNRHPAGFVVLRPGAAAQRFADDAAALIGDSLGRGRRLWFLDQWALLLAARRHRPRRIPAAWTYDTGFGPRSWVWQASDARKAQDPFYLAERDRLTARAERAS